MLLSRWRFGGHGDDVTPTVVSREKVLVANREAPIRSVSYNDCVTMLAYGFINRASFIKHEVWFRGINVNIIQTFCYRTLWIWVHTEHIGIYGSVFCLSAELYAMFHQSADLSSYSSATSFSAGEYFLITIVTHHSVSHPFYSKHWKFADWLHIETKFAVVLYSKFYRNKELLTHIGTR